MREQANETGFGSLYYTDCVPGQGLQGGAGFQFQAASPGLPPEAMPIVQRTALYEPPASWMQGRRPPSDYPLSLAHTGDGLFVTATGRYLGQEANGTREGNQFTHALVTKDVAAYGLLRPAQLWAAPCWATGPAPGTELEVLREYPAPGPLDIETVRERVRDTTGGQERLIALLSAIQHLEDPERRRGVVLVSADPERAACWIAAATLLLPQPRALRAGFKIFVADAQYGQHDIVALHPEWAGRWADTGPGSGLAVFDLDRGRHSEVEPTEAARFWVPRFLAADVFDVVDAVELASQFARARPGGAEQVVEPTAADRSVAVIVAVGERLRTPGQLERVAHWLLTAPEQAIGIARDAALEAVLAASPPAPVLRTLADAAGSGGWSAAASIRDGLLTAEIGEALDAADGVAATRASRELGSLPPRSDGDDPEPARSRVEAALRTARPDHVPALLTVAHRHGLHPSPARFPEAADRFASWWVDHTGSTAVAELDPRTWQVAPEVLDWIRDVLQHRIRGAQRAGAVRAVRAYWWELLLTEQWDLGDPLDAVVIGAAYEHLPPPERRTLIRNVQFAAFAARSEGVPPATRAWHTLFTFCAPDVLNARYFLVELVAQDLPVSPEVWNRLGDVVADERTLNEGNLYLAAHLLGKGVALPPMLADAQASDAAIHRVDRELRSTKPRTTADVLATDLNGASRELLDIRADRLANALLEAPHDTAVAVLQACSPPVATRLLHALAARWPRDLDRGVDPVADRAVALVFLMLDPVPGGRQVRFTELAERLEALVRPASEQARRRVNQSYRGGLPPAWWDWIAHIESGRLTKWLKSEDRPRLGLRQRSKADQEEDRPPSKKAAESAGPSGKRGE